MFPVRNHVLFRPGGIIANVVHTSKSKKKVQYCICTFDCILEEESARSNSLIPSQLASGILMLLIFPLSSDAKFEPSMPS
jgi:hypothetical protein